MTGLLFRGLLSLILLARAQEVLAVDAALHRVPDEYESIGGHGLALGNSGVAAMGGLSSVRANPAMLPLEKQYRVGGGYHWPTSGREFYQAGVVDSTTSDFAAGVLYTGYTDSFLYPDERPEDQAEHLDSPVVRRGVIGVGHAFKMFSVGLGAQYVEGEALTTSRERANELGRVKGTGVTLGVAALLTEQLRVGAAAENISNRKIENYAPTTYRAGLAYLINANVAVNLDLRQRERVDFFEAPPINPVTGENTKSNLSPERMAIISGSARVQDFLRVLGSYGSEISGTRRSLAGGVAVVQEKFSIAYNVQKPHTTLSETHQSISVALEIAF